MTEPFKTWAALAAVVLLVPASVAGQAPLPVGGTSAANLASTGSASFTYQATAAGFLTVVVRAAADRDVSLSIADEDGQAIPGGQSDMDFGGNVGAEQLVVTLPYPGSYTVQVRSYMEGEGAFDIGASFLASPLAGGVMDPDGRPSSARELTVGADHEDAIDPGQGDNWDWYRIPVSASGVLTVLTRTDGEGDLRLERFISGEFGEAVDASDQDMEGVLGNESLTVSVTAGDVVYLRVASAFGGGGRTPYRIVSGLIPG